MAVVIGADFGSDEPKLLVNVEISGMVDPLK